MNSTLKKLIDGYISMNVKLNMEDNKMNRSLNSRHISMIAIGGAIGTGLFVATGNIISQAGPGGAILAYLVIGVMLYFLMSSIGELATFYPVSGSLGSIIQHALLTHL
ncbi:hypothetical protein ACVXZY_07515 [Staphylococcus aureus]